MPIDLASRAYLLGLPELPGLSPDESALVLDFVRRHCAPIDHFSVAVPVGPGDTSSASISAAIDRMWANITRRKIDLIIWRWTCTVIVEAKVHARMPAATQVLRYVDLFRRDRDVLAPVVPIVLCRSCVPGLARVLEQYGGDVITMSAPGLSAEASA
jgi:hypothetical protein